MNLLREYIRNLLVEQDEEERTVEQKLKDLFFSPGGSALQAVELARSYGDVDPEFMQLMEDVFETAHNMITSYLYYAEAYAEGDFEEESTYKTLEADLNIKGDGYEQRRYHADEEHNEYRKAMQALDKYGEAEGFNVGRSPRWEGGNQISKIFTKLRTLTVYPKDIKGPPKEEQSYKDAIAWAGAPS
jgi:hypothetical protein